MKRKPNAHSLFRILLHSILLTMMAARSSTPAILNAPKAVRRGAIELLPCCTRQSPFINFRLSNGPVYKGGHPILQIQGGSSSTDTTQSAAPKWRRAYLGVGSNMGNQFQNIADALSQLQSTGTLKLVRTSFLRRTAPMYITDQPAFLNGAVEIETLLSPLELLRELKRVEGGLGRDLSGNALRNGPRPVDLDILLFDGFRVQTEDSVAADTMSDNNMLPWALRMRTDELEIPHPRITEWEFVLAPLNDLDSKNVHPVLNKTLSDLLSSLRCKSANPNKKDADVAARILPLPRGRMLVFNETMIMGILNVTPDSFSDGRKFDSVEVAAKQVMQLERDGAKIIDVGGKSIRPGAEEVDVEEEMRRVIPVISRIRKESDIIISVETQHSLVAKAAIEAGADIVIDVSGGTHDPQMLSFIACMGVPIILMHMRGNPKTMQSLTNYSGEGVVSGVAHGLMQRSAAAEAAGVPPWMQVLGPGIGFAKDGDGNLALLNRADFLRNSCEGIPFLFGPSREGFIGKVTGEDDPSERDFGTVAACLAVLQSKREDLCNILRVHNVKAMKQAVFVWDAIRNSQHSNEPSS